MGAPKFIAKLDIGSDSLGMSEARAVLLGVLPFHLWDLMLTLSNKHQNCVVGPPSWCQRIGVRIQCAHPLIRIVL